MKVLSLFGCCVLLFCSACTKSPDFACGDGWGNSIQRNNLSATIKKNAATGEFYLCPTENNALQLVPCSLQIAFMQENLDVLVTGIENGDANDTKRHDFVIQTIIKK
jgi:hypothetical protein